MRAPSVFDHPIYFNYYTLCLMVVNDSNRNSGDLRCFRKATGDKVTLQLTVYRMSASVNMRFLRNVSCFFLGYWLSAFRVIDNER